ncbi:serine/threonine-protein kinase [Pyxidicoccus sp. MSG2]|uniref:serine/threonine-protein kinase n=1 Tax=Pyxidicoccus sp. MSG2 TaxID=2996790 RepID=UPI00226EF904|nr:serine/threonine-protein kinase [Pyxidicoccus sp. MSG2]MCY1020226.1 protein kinase [Pyxidicoccus sp. MSG2]
MTRPSDGDLRTDTVLRNTYKIASVLGRGGMGSVYLAQHLRLPGKQVAVKVLRGGDHLTQEIFTRFRREAEIASRLGHPNIVEVLDYDTLEDGTPFLVLEFLRGESLQSRLERGPLTLPEVFSYTRQMGSALQAAHGAGIVHRDLKPANVFLVPTDSGGVVGQRLKLLDFGISKVLSSETLQTQEATIIGTPQYMSPEQAMGKNREIDARTDIFALGCIVYEMMTGKPVFGAGSLAQMIFRVVYEPADPLAPLCPEAPAHAIAAVDRALSKKAEDRFPDVTSFVEALTGSPLHTLSPPSGSQPMPRAVPKAPSGIALPSQDAAEGFDATVAPGSVKVVPDSTGRMGVVEVGNGGSGTGRMGLVQPEPPVGSGTGRMGMVQPEAPVGSGTGRMGAPLLDPPGLEPTLISKEVPAVPPRPAQPITAVTPPAQAAPQPIAAPVSVAPAPQPVPVAVAQLVAKSRAPMIAAAVALFAAGGGLVWWMGRPVTPPTAPAISTQNPSPQAAVQQPTTGTPNGTQAAVGTSNGTQPAATGADNNTQTAVQPPPTTTPPTVATTTTDKPDTTRPVSKKEVLPAEVQAVLDEAAQALKAGNAEEAIRLAKRSQRAKPGIIPLASYSIIVRAACLQGNLTVAKQEWSKVPASDKPKLRQFCQQHDTDPAL